MSFFRSVCGDRDGKGGTRRVFCCLKQVSKLISRYRVQGGVRGENALGEQGQAVRGRILTPPERSRRPARGAEFLPVQ